MRDNLLCKVCLCVCVFSFFFFSFIHFMNIELSKIIHIPRIWPCWNLCNDTHSHSLSLSLLTLSTTIGPTNENGRKQNFSFGFFGRFFLLLLFFTVIAKIVLETFCSTILLLLFFYCHCRLRQLNNDGKYWVQSTAKMKASVYLRKQKNIYFFFFIIILRRLTSICVLNSGSSIATQANRKAKKDGRTEMVRTNGNPCDQGQEFIFFCRKIIMFVNRFN